MKNSHEDRYEKKLRKFLKELDNIHNYYYDDYLDYKETNKR